MSSIKNTVIIFFKSHIIAIILFILVVVSPLYAITKILGGNVDGTPPSTVSSPSGIVTMLTTSGAWYTNQGTFYGSKTIDRNIYSSSDGVTWVQGNFHFFGYSAVSLFKTANSNWLLTNGTCIKRSTDDLQTFVTVLGSCATNDENIGNRIISNEDIPTDIYAILDDTLYKSTNDGQNWSTVYTHNQCSTGREKFVFAKGNVISWVESAGSVGFSCGLSIKTSIDGGNTFTVQVFPNSISGEFAEIAYFKNYYWLFKQKAGNIADTLMYVSSDPTNYSTLVQTIENVLALASPTKILTLTDGYNPERLYMLTKRIDTNFYTISISTGCDGACNGSNPLLFNLVNIDTANNMGQSGNFFYSSSNNSIYTGSQKNRFYKIE